ncbi:MAG: hypothetical protein HQL37_01125 [Alphaproteobacteria bacterium]|nr:hypothetical protein [Alphaproteobacteria bacterium]
MLVSVALYAVIQFTILPPTPILQPDSASYLDFSAIRTAGYPLFLGFFGTNGAMYAQTLSYAAALAMLGCEVVRARGTFVLALGLVVAIMVNPYLNLYHAMILTESLFTSLLLFFLAALIRFSCTRHWRWAMVAAVAAGLAATVRPTGYAFLPVLVLMVLMNRRHRFTGRSLAVVMAAAIVPMLLLVGSERAYTRIHHGAAATSLAGRHFFAKAAMVEAPARSQTETDPMRQRLFAALEMDFAPVRALVREAPTDDIERLLMESYETCIEYFCSDKVRAEVGLPEAAMNNVALGVGLERLAGAPLGYLALSWRHYKDMWVLYTHPDQITVIIAFIAAHRPLPFEPMMTELAKIVTPGGKAIVIRGGMFALGWITGGLSMLCLVVSWNGGAIPPLNAAGLLAAVTVHSALLLTAALGVGIPRYTLGMWPAMALALAAVAQFVLERRLPGKRRLGQGYFVRAPESPESRGQYHGNSDSI